VWKEESATAATASAAAAGPDRFDFREPELDPVRAVCFLDVADQQRDRRVD